MRGVMVHGPATLLAVLLSFLLLSSLVSSRPSFITAVGHAGGSRNNEQKLAGENPFTAKASLVRYWKTQISNELPKPRFFLDKASPLNAVELATFSKLADQNSLSGHLREFCSRANLLCAPELSTSLGVKYNTDVNFTTYGQQNFTEYGTRREGGTDEFKNYSNGEIYPKNNFQRYSRSSDSHSHEFTNYGVHGTLGDQSFTNYGKNAVGAADGKFSNYQDGEYIANLKFNSYDDNSNGGRTKTFTSYSTSTYQGQQDFNSYDKNGIGPESDFNSYSNRSKYFTSTFTHYGETGHGTRDTFNQYGLYGDMPRNNFTSYADHGDGELVFQNYRDDASMGEDDFTSYAKQAALTNAYFENYGQSMSHTPVNFASYGEGADDQTKIDFNTYGKNYDFQKYAKDGVTFENYLNETAPRTGEKISHNKRWVEPGKFFRESMLKPGTVMPMPDIRDKMPKRSFLPRVIASKLPFSSARICELKEIFQAGDDNSRMARTIGDALHECERAPSPGETKRCMGSGEDMIDFAASVLGRNIAVRSTENTQGSSGDIMIGSVEAINGGRITKSVSCHQSLYPYLLYYCHSVPKVRVYEADILDPNTKAKINHGVAICHADTSSWSPGHAAFLALGPGPGKIEVCHWIFENDLSWVIADVKMDESE